MARSTSRVRSGLVGVLFVLACLSITLTTIGVWAHQTLLVTDRFAAVTSRVVAEPGVQAAAATRLADQIVTAADIQGRIAEVMPGRSAVLAGPITNAVEGFLEKHLTTFFANERAQAAFDKAIRFAHARLVTLLRNESDFVTANGTTVTIDLLPIAVEGLRVLQTEGILPASITLPDVVDPEGRAAAIANLESALGRDLPEDFATIPIANATRLAAAQTAVRAFDIAVIVLIVLSIALVLLTIVLSGRRLRMVALLALGIVVSLVIARLVIRAALTGIVDSLATGDAVTVRAIITDVVTDLASWSWILVIVGLVVAVAAVLVGRPGGLSTDTIRSPEGISAWGRDHTNGIGWAVGILLTSLVVWIAMSPDLAILVGIGLVLVALTIGRRGRDDRPTVAGPT